MRTRTATRRAAVRCLITVCAAAALAGCASSAAPAPAVTAPPASTDPAALALPVETYLYTPEQLAELDRATFAVANACMSRYGLTLPARPQLPAQYSGNLVALRYGPSELQSASAYGYHRTTSGSNDEQSARIPPMTGDQAMVYQGRKIGAAATSPGTPPVYHGVAVPPGGCLGEAQRRIAGSEPSGQSPHAQQIKDDGYTRSAADPRVVAVVKAWSQCMRARGFDYATPTDAFSDRRWSTPSATQTEIATAVADVTCKRQANLIGTWYAVESAYEQREIAQQSAALNAELAAKRSELAQAASIVAKP